ncbi:MAG: DUF2865 domain-containing protein [Pseudolabrys sp.]|nr:DUF2865 domain-containing protein [Pseudolabrys sp.]
MNRLVRLTAAAICLLTAADAAAQAPNPFCQRLEAQLAAIDRGGADPARAEQLRRYDETLNRQQFELDRLTAQARRLDCGSSGLFSIFQTPAPQCDGLNRQIEQARGQITRMRGEMQQFDGNLDRAEQRRNVLMALGDNNCGPQYRSAAAPRNFLDSLFGGNSGGSGGYSTADGASGTFRTICVRTCDGYYYPISYATSPARFRDDEQTCQRTCPAAQVSLYTYRNPGEDVAQAVSLSGAPYSSLPTAFRYRQQYDKACSCRQAGQSWADALKQTGDALEQGDVVVTQERAKQMALPRDSRGRPIRAPAGRAAQADATPATAEPSRDDSGDNGRSGVRSVGPQFMPTR